MKLAIFLLSMSAYLMVNGQYTTPGTGVVWNLDSLVQHSTAVTLISAHNYRITEDITIASTDSVFILKNNIRFANNVRITVEAHAGLYLFGGSNSGSLVADVTGEKYNGFRLEDSSHVAIDSVRIANCGGIKVLTRHFKIENSLLENCVTGINTSGVIQLTRGKPIIINNTFKNNVISALSSAANATVTPIVTGNFIESNVAGNTNTPQISLSNSGTTDTTFIEDNTIIGNTNYNQAGGIGFSSFVGVNGNVVIRNNQISNNRYGIALLGNGINGLIDNNVIDNNNTENIPNLGGSGISLNGNATSNVMISNNTISNNLWGVTIQGTFAANLGDAHIGGNNPGQNSFSENINGGQTYALFNNTPNQVYATNNCWDLNAAPTLQNAENVISHQVDDNTLGEVIFDPILLCTASAVENEGEELISIYPNPVSEMLHIKLPETKSLVSVAVYSLSGKKIEVDATVTSTAIQITTASLTPGVYFLQLRGDNFFKNEKIIKH